MKKERDTWSATRESAGFSLAVGHLRESYRSRTLVPGTGRESESEIIASNGAGLFAAANIRGIGGRSKDFMGRETAVWEVWIDGTERRRDRKTVIQREEEIGKQAE